MSNFEETLILPIEDLSERRAILRKELSKTVVELVTRSIRDSIENAFANADLPKKLTRVTWEFHGEYDDEGGTAYYPSYIQIYNEDGEIDESELEGIIIKEKSSHSDYIFEYSADEYISDLLHEYSSELYEYDIEEILL